MFIINKTETVVRAVLYNNRTISVVPSGFQMAISVTARRPDSEAQRTTSNKHTSALCAASMTFRYLRSAARYERSEVLPEKQA
jgi:aspartokinase-like uncharacterized kinase